MVQTPLSPVFINEFHYDDVSTDEGEFIEVVGPAGTNLDGWSLVLYNGSTGAEYNTITLSGLLADTFDGYGANVTNLPVNGLQNGSPDGIALVDDTGSVVEFISYEGTFTAAGGAADGLTSTDIGVEESGSTLEGSSLQRTGTGTQAGDFTWLGPVPATANSANAGQSFGTTSGPPSVFISEFHYDNDGTDVGEFIEVTGDAGTDLTGWALVLYNGNNGTSYNTLTLSETLSDQDGGLGTTVVELPTNGLQNGSPDGIALVDADGTVVEFLSYEGSFTAGNGPADGMTSVDIGVEETGDTPVGQSLQKIDGVWTGPASDTKGVVNGADPLPTLSIDDVSQAEGDSGSSDFTFTVTRSGDTSGTASVDFATADGSADSSDYTGTSGTLTFAEGETEQIVTVSVNGDTDAETNETFTVALSNASGATLANDTGTGTIENDDGMPVTLISTIQGSGATSALDDQVVTISGVVVGEYLSGLGGFYVQEEANESDGDASTSEGIFVSNFGGPFDGAGLVEGDRIQITGTVNERFGMTRIEDVTAFETLLPDPTATVEAAQVTLPITGDVDAYFEAFEGMLVTFDQELTITQLFNYERFGELQLSSQGRVFQYTQLNAPDVEGNAAWQEADALSRIVLDDGQTGQNPDTLPFLDVPEFSAGDTIDDLKGVLSFGFDRWALQPTEAAPIVFENTNPRQETPEDVGGNLKIASFNVLNYFTTLDQPGNDVNGLDPRGANSEAELARQTSKIVAALSEMDADVYGLIEIENDADDASAKALVAALNAELAAAGSSRVFDVVETGQIGTDAIKVAFIYDTTSVKIAEGTSVAVLDTDAFVAPVSTVLDPNDLLPTDPKNRPALAVTFEELATGAQFTAVNNHLKSKGSGVDGEDEGPILTGSDLGTIDGVQPTVDIDDGQGSGSATRESAADQLVDWLATNPTGASDPDVLILGDLNAYAQETAIAQILEGADDTLGTEDDFTDLAQEFEGDDAYSFRFSGQWGTLDYALANDPMLSQVTGVTEWHINADEPGYLDYNDNVQDPDTGFDSEDGLERDFEVLPDALEAQFDGESPFRSSDHDPVIVGLNLTAPAPGTALARLDFEERPGRDAVVYSLDGEEVTTDRLRFLQNDIRIDEAGIRIDADDNLWWSPEYITTAGQGIGIWSIFSDRFFGRDRKLVDGKEELSFDLDATDGLGDALGVTLEFATLRGRGDVELTFYDDGTQIAQQVLEIVDDQVSYALSDDATFDRVEVSATGSLNFSVGAAEFERLVDDGMGIA